MSSKIKSNQHLYAILLDPTQTRAMIKCGKTVDPEDRLLKFKTPCPHAVLLASWKTDLDEATFLRCVGKLPGVTRQNHKNGRCEVFYVEDIAAAIAGMKRIIKELT